MSAGRLLSISGVDGAGKSTQLALLRTHLEERGYRCAAHLFEATSYGHRAVAEIDRVITGGVECLFTRVSIDWMDRYPLARDFINEADLQTPELALAVTAIFAGACVQVYACCIRPLLERGVHVICDRYWYDDLVYRGYWVDDALVRQLYAPLRVPDLAVLIDVPPATTLRRNRARSDRRSPLLRDAAAIDEVRRRFLGMARRESLIVIDGDRLASLVSAEVTAHALALLGSRET